MLSCREATKMMSDGLDRRLTRWQRLQLRLHVTMCSACRAYRHQLQRLHALLRRRFSDDPQPTEDEQLSDAARQRIRQRLHHDQSHGS